MFHFFFIFQSIAFDREYQNQQHIDLLAEKWIQNKDIQYDVPKSQHLFENDCNNAQVDLNTIKASNENKFTKFTENNKNDSNLNNNNNCKAVNNNKNKQPNNKKDINELKNSDKSISAAVDAPNCLAFDDDIDNVVLDGHENETNNFPETDNREFKRKTNANSFYRGTFNHESSTQSNASFGSTVSQSFSTHSTVLPRGSTRNSPSEGKSFFFGFYNISFSLNLKLRIFSAFNICLP